MGEREIPYFGNEGQSKRNEAVGWLIEESILLGL